MITVTRTRDEDAGHTTERGSKLSVPLRKIHKYYVNIIRSIKILFPKTIRTNHSVAAVAS